MLLTKLRAALTIGSLWGIAVGAVGAALGGLLPTTSAFSLGLVGGFVGLVLGAGFGGLLSIMEGRRTLDELTSRRASRWGFVVGASVAVIGTIGVGSVTGLGPAAVELGLSLAMQLTTVATVAISYGAITAGLAAGTVSLAKRRPPELSPGRSPSLPGRSPSPDIISRGRKLRPKTDFDA